MRENRPSGSEGGGAGKPGPPYPYPGYINVVVARAEERSEIVPPL